MAQLDEARGIAVARIALGVATVLNALEIHRLLVRIAEGRLRVPVAEAFPAPTEAAVWALTCVTVLAGVALVLGWRPAGAAAVATVASLLCLLWDQQTYSNHRVLALVLVGLLVLARSDRVWAVRRRPRPAPVPWVQLLMMTQLSVCYLFAGVSKMNPVFPSGYVFDSWLWLDLPHWFDMGMALGTVVVEVFLAIGLWLRRTRVPAMVLGVLLHASIVTLMDKDNLTLLAFSLTCVPLYVLFLTWDRVRPAPVEPLVRKNVAATS